VHACITKQIAYPYTVQIAEKARAVPAQCCAAKPSRCGHDHAALLLRKAYYGFDDIFWPSERLLSYKLRRVPRVDGNEAHHVVHLLIGDIKFVPEQYHRQSAPTPSKKHCARSQLLLSRARCPSNATARGWHAEGRPDVPVHATAEGALLDTIRLRLTIIHGLSRDGPGVGCDRSRHNLPPGRTAGTSARRAGT
jgi:hypothetical protein